METTNLVATNFHNTYHGKNWTGSYLNEIIEDITLAEATQKVQNLNTIHTLLHHMNYYVRIAIQVLNGGPLEGTDKESFEHPQLNDENAWTQFKRTIFADATELKELIEKLPNDQWTKPFDTGKYGNYYRNLAGIIEHNHYHMGQIAIIKKMVRNN